MISEIRRFAVLIDAENISAKYAQAIFQEVSTFGEASVRRLYCDVGQNGVSAWLDMQTELGIVPVHQPKNTVGKNASDIALVIDAMDLLHSGRMDGFVLVSSDSDFTRLAQRIREQGIDVIGMGERKTPEAFRMACKRFLWVENLGVDGTAADWQNKSANGGGDLNRAYQLISNVLSDSTDAEGWARLSWLGSQIIQRYSDFDTRSFGFKRLSDLIRATGRFEERGEGSKHWVRLKTK